jgi:hypothetical protein
MDFKIWFYLIIGAIWLIARILKKPAQQPTSTNTGQGKSSTPYQSNSERPKQLTFEELLREITEAKETQKPVYQQPSRQPQYVEADVVEENRSLEKVDYDYRKKDKEYYDVYENAKRQAFERPSLEETMNVRDTQMAFGKFREFEQEQKRNLLVEYTKDFQDPEGIRKAFVMSEILNRKF